MASEGAIANWLGVVAASAVETIRANGFKFNFLNSDSDMRTKAEAPSFNVDAFAAVMVPKIRFKVRDMRDKKND